MSLAFYNDVYKRNQPQIFPAEVIDVLYSDEIPEYPYAIKARDYNTPGVAASNIILARPLNYNIKQIPIIGETVLLIRTVSPSGTFLGLLEDIYYISIVGVQGNAHHNASPASTYIVNTSDSKNSENYENSSNGNSNTGDEDSERNTIDENFPENPNVKTLQPYLGDVIIEGRFGSSLRLSSTQNTTNLFKFTPIWEQGDGAAGDPIILLRNTSNHTDTGQYNDFVTENLSDDSTNLVITSTQKIDFTPVISIPNVLQNAGIETQFQGNQTILSSGRIILNSKEKDLTVTAATAIGLATDKFALESNETIISSNKVKIGSNANEPMVLGNQLKNLMNQLVTAIGNLTVTVTTPTGPGQTLPLTTSPAWGSVQAALNQFDNALSRFAYVAQSNNSNTASNTNRPAARVATSRTPEEQQAAEENAEAVQFEIEYTNEQGIPQEDYDELTQLMIEREISIADSNDADPIIQNTTEMTTTSDNIIQSINDTSTTVFYS